MVRLARLRNIKVGRLAHGGWNGELDIVAFHPQSQELVHLEPSIDAHPWTRREERFAKKFECGRKHIYKDVFPWLDQETTTLEQVAVLISRGKRTELAGGRIVTIDEFIAEIRLDIEHEGIMAKRAIPEQYNLLRTAQLFVSGYYGRVAGDAVGD